MKSVRHQSKTSTSKSNLNPLKVTSPQKRRPVGAIHGITSTAQSGARARSVHTSSHKTSSIKRSLQSTSTTQKRGSTVASRRALATQVTSAPAPSIEPEIEPIIFPKGVSEREYIKPIPMPYSRGQAWGQVLVGNHELPTPTGTWTPNSRRSGVMFNKVGMVSIFDAHGRRHGVTVLNINNCQVINTHAKPDKHGYINQEIGNQDRKEKNVTLPMLGHFHRAKVHPKQYVRSSKISADAALPVGWTFDVRHFMVGQYVDIFGTSKGKGFQGVMKRYGFGGQPATHGVSITHRSLGSTGQRQDPGKVFKLKKMPGHMGMNNVVMENVFIMKVDPKRQLIFVKGQVPGPAGASVFLRDSLKKPHSPENPPPFPTFVPPADDPMEELTLPIEALGPDPYANGMVV